MSFIVANGTFSVWFCNAYTKSCNASVDTSVDETLGVLIFWGGDSTTSEILYDIVYFSNAL